MVGKKCNVVLILRFYVYILVDFVSNARLIGEIHVIEITAIIIIIINIIIIFYRFCIALFSALLRRPSALLSK